MCNAARQQQASSMSLSHLSIEATLRGSKQPATRRTRTCVCPIIHIETQDTLPAKLPTPTAPRDSQPSTSPPPRTVTLPRRSFCRDAHGDRAMSHLREECLLVGDPLGVARRLGGGALPVPVVAARGAVGIKLALTDTTRAVPDLRLGFRGVTTEGGRRAVAVSMLKADCREENSTHRLTLHEWLRRRHLKGFISVHRSPSSRCQMSQALT
jgi:hypothetical protein